MRNLSLVILSLAVILSGIYNDPGEMDDDRAMIWKPVEAMITSCRINSDPVTEAGHCSYPEDHYNYRSSVRSEPDDFDPILEILAPGNGDVIGTRAIRAEWVGADNESGIDHYQIKMDLGGWVHMGTLEEYSYFDLADGTHIFKVKAIDGSGREVVKEVTFLVDRGKPTVTIHSPSDGELLNRNSTQVRWRATDDLSMIVRYEYSIDGGVINDAGFTSSVDIINMSEGSHQVEVFAYDQAGNMNSSRITFIVDSIPPDLELISPRPGGFIGERDVNVVWSGSDQGTGILDFGVRLDDQNWIDAGQRTDRSFYQLEDGQHIIRVRARDLAGNVRIEEVPFTIDVSPPELEILFPLSGARISQLPVTIQWLASDDISGLDAVQFRDNVSGWRNVNASSYPLPATEEGTYQVWVRAFDMVGNMVERTTIFTVDRTPPRVLEFGPSTYTSQLDPIIFVSFSERMSTESLSFRVADVEGMVIWKGGMATFVPDSDILLPGRQYNVTVTASDVAGNKIQPITWTFNTTAHGVVRGKVVDEDGRPVTGANIIIGDQSMINRFDGSFIIETTYGNHELTIKRDGYEKRALGVNITAGAILELGEIEIETEEEKEINLLTLLLIPAAIFFMVILAVLGGGLLRRRMMIDEE